MSDRKVIVKFELDLKDLVPTDSDLKSHDLPIETWLMDAAYEIIFRQALDGILENKIDAVIANAKAEVVRDAAIEHYDAMIFKLTFGTDWINQKE